LAVREWFSVATEIATETDAAYATTFERITAPGIAEETDSAYAVALRKTATVNPSSETDGAFAPLLAQPNAIPIGVASETDTALAAEITQVVGVAEGAAGGIVIRYRLPERPAEAIREPIIISVGIVNEFDDAFAPVLRREIRTQPAIAVELALPPDTIAKELKPEAVREPSQAIPPRIVRSTHVGIAEESTHAPGRFEFIHRVGVGTASVDTEACAPRVSRRIETTTAIGRNESHSREIEKRVAVSAAAEGSIPKSLRIQKRTRINTAEDHGVSERIPLQRMIRTQPSMVDWIGIEDEEILEVLQLAS
jgi:hypothetical protein